MRGAPLYNPRPREGVVWRLAGAAEPSALMKLVDSAADLVLLEAALDRVVPPPPHDGRHLPALMTEPFRGPVWAGSRFRRAGGTAGIFYGSEEIETAVADAAFRRLMFIAECPGLALPSRPLDFTGYAVPYTTRRCLDLTLPPDDQAVAVWTDPADHRRCQALADIARDMGCDAIRSVSARGRLGSHDVALLSCRAFAAPGPVARQRWRMGLSTGGVIAMAEHPPRRIGLSPSDFAREPRLRMFHWDR